MFATKVSSMDLLYELWKNIIKENDTIFPCFVGVALLEKFKDQIIGKDYPLIPMALNKIIISSESELKDILCRSYEFKKCLPLSISTKLKNYDMFSLKNIDSYTRALSRFSCLSILPREILHLTYPEVKFCNCPDVCNMCRSVFPILVIDCRTYEQHELGYFPNTEFFNEDIIENPFAIKDYPVKFLPIQGIYHFALLGNDDINYNSTGCDNQSTINQLIKAFLDLEFPYVSIIEGGYKSCHEFAMHYKLHILSHSHVNCNLCASQTKVYRKNKKTPTQVFEDNYREKIRITSAMQTFECKKYDKAMKGNLPDKLVFVISYEHIIITDIDTNAIEKYLLKELYKITKINNSSKTLVFYFADTKEKKSFSFASKKQAEECRSQVSAAFKSLKNGIHKNLI